MIEDEEVDVKGEYVKEEIKDMLVDVNYAIANSLGEAKYNIDNDNDDYSAVKESLDDAKDKISELEELLDW